MLCPVKDKPVVIPAAVSEVPIEVPFKAAALGMVPVDFPLRKNSGELEEALFS